MSSISDFLNTPLLHAIGAGLLHFLWQGALVASLLALVLKATKKASPQLRYLMAWTALLFMLIMPITTITRTLPNTQTPALHYTNTPTPQNPVTPTPPNPSTPTPQHPSTPTPQNSIIPILPILSLAWMLGVCFFAFQLHRGMLQTRKLRLETGCFKPHVTASLKRLANRMGIGRPVEIRTSLAIDQPLMLGWLEPVILLPASLLGGIPLHQLEAILAHELAHIKRHDYLFASIQSMIETLLFFHPAVWWVSNQINIEREYCCDDLAVATLDNKKLYLQTLAGLEVSRQRMPNLALSMKGGSLLSRIRRLVEPTPQTGNLMINKSAFLAGFLLFILTCTGITACNDYSLTDSATSAINTDIELPADLAQKISANDIEGTITQLHELREAGHPDALSIAIGTYNKTPDAELRQNLVFVFAHFNSFEADNYLIHVAKTDADFMVRSHALRAISLRLDPDPRYLNVVDNSFYSQDATLYAYPEISQEQLNALYPVLKEIAQDAKQHAYVTKKAISIISRSPQSEGFLMEIYNKSSNKEVRLAAVRNLDLTPDQKVQLYTALYDVSDQDAFKRTLALHIAETQTIEAVPIIATMIRDEMAKSEQQNPPVFALLILINALPPSTYPQIREMIDYDQILTQDWGIHKQEAEYLIKWLAP